VAQDVAIAEATMAVDRECRVVGHRIVEIEPAEPSVGQMQLDFLTQPPPETDAVAVASIRIISSGSIEGRPISL